MMFTSPYCLAELWFCQIKVIPQRSQAWAYTDGGVSEYTGNQRMIILWCLPYSKDRSKCCFLMLPHIPGEGLFFQPYSPMHLSQSRAKVLRRMPLLNQCYLVWGKHWEVSFIKQAFIHPSSLNLKSSSSDYLIISHIYSLTQKFLN